MGAAVLPCILITHLFMFGAGSTARWLMNISRIYSYETRNCTESSDVCYWFCNEWEADYKRCRYTKVYIELVVLSWPVWMNNRSTDNHYNRKCKAFCKAFLTSQNMSFLLTPPGITIGNLLLYSAPCFSTIRDNPVGQNTTLIHYLNLWWHQRFCDWLNLDVSRAKR